MFVNIGFVITGVLPTNNMLMFWNGDNWKQSAVDLTNYCIIPHDDPRLPEIMFNLHSYKAETHEMFMPANVEVLNFGLMFSDSGLRYAVADLSPEQRMDFRRFGIGL